MRFCLLVLALPALTACFVPLTAEDREAYRNRPGAQASRAPAAPVVQRAPVAVVQRRVQKPVIAPQSAPTQSVSREALAPLPSKVQIAVLPAANRQPAAASSPRHVVQKGDTVYGLSRKFGITKEALIAKNGLARPYILSVGQELVIPTAAKVLGSAPLAGGSKPVATPAGSKPHKVAKGETVYGIARANQVPLRSLIELNGLRPPYGLAVGQNLKVPQKRHHRVAKGETVYSIAKAYEIDQSELVRVNAIAAPFTIKPGDRVVLPGRAPAAARAAPSGSAPQRQAPLQTARAHPAPAVIPQPPPRAANQFLWPVRGQVILAYGPKKGGLHNDGINIAAPRGTPVLAAENGVIVYTGNELRGFGNLVLMRHAGGWVTAYAHAEELLVRRGDTVRRGQPIGRVGSSGSVARPQLHFEVRKGTRAVDPSRLLGSQTATLGN